MGMMRFFRRIESSIKPDDLFRPGPEYDMPDSIMELYMANYKRLLDENDMMISRARCRDAVSIPWYLLPTVPLTKHPQPNTGEDMELKISKSII